MFEKITSTIELTAKVEKLTNIDLSNGPLTWGQHAQRLERWAAETKFGESHKNKMLEKAKLIRLAEARWFELEG